VCIHQSVYVTTQTEKERASDAKSETRPSKVLGAQPTQNCDSAISLYVITAYWLMFVYKERRQKRRRRKEGEEDKTRQISLNNFTCKCLASNLTLCWESQGQNAKDHNVNGICGHILVVHLSCAVQGVHVINAFMGNPLLFGMHNVMNKPAFIKLTSIGEVSRQNTGELLASWQIENPTVNIA